MSEEVRVLHRWRMFVSWPVSEEDARAYAEGGGAVHRIGGSVSIHPPYCDVCGLEWSQAGPECSGRRLEGVEVPVISTIEVGGSSSGE